MCSAPRSLDDACLMLMLTMQLYPRVRFVLCDLFETQIKRRFVIVSWPCSPLLPLVSSIWLYSGPEVSCVVLPDMQLYHALLPECRRPSRPACTLMLIWGNQNGLPDPARRKRSFVTCRRGRILLCQALTSLCRACYPQLQNAGISSRL